MKAMQHTPLMLALAGMLSLPGVLMAADAAQDEHSGHHPEQAQTQPQPATPDRLQTLRERMMEMRRT